MSLNEIKDAVEAGKAVHWANTGYVVIKDRVGQFLIKCTSNDSIIGLTHRDGVTLNGKPEEFFLA
ncbi:hypothetical protein RYA05_04220 [Pseudomonas syringae pv. actinidiae]|uniref:hypothetical protein n=1 Tax=Pseudomonas viridiflava TaxID=33069 RepID=UPI0018E610AF|nr:hypothetical protein [Pseudomonas viridiflava]MBI6727142.1 hypothetical protein [Pseudomonas viridiflava]MDU8351100.1 hypothetical protein [Pseudomonas syringae pv. actinidiae]